MEVAQTTANAARDEFLNLLVTQLRHQDPLEPVKQEDFLGQLAQFSSLEGIEKLNSNFEGYLHLQEQMLHVQSLSGASNLVGQEVVYESQNTDLETDGGSADTNQTGVVDAVVVEAGQIQLRIGDKSVPVESLIEIRGDVSAA